MWSTGESPLAGRRVLIVEDEYFLADDLRLMLVEQRVNVVGPVPSLSAGLSVIESDGLDCAVLDVNLGGEDVFAICNALARRNIPFLFVTGFGSGQIPPEFRHVPRLDKPLDRAALFDALRELMPASQA